MLNETSTKYYFISVKNKILSFDNKGQHDILYSYVNKIYWALTEINGPENRSITNFYIINDRRGVVSLFRVMSI